MKKFLLLQSRPEDEASDNEFEAFCALGNIDPAMVERVRMDKGELPAINLEEYAGVLMGGGPANFAYSHEQKSETQKVFEPWLYELFGRIVVQDKPFLGACLGFSLAVKYLGGVVSFDYGEPIHAAKIVLSPAAAHDRLLEGIPNTFNAFVGHKEGAMTVPNGAIELARSTTCAQMLRIGKNVYATQFHPELDLPGLILRIRIYQNAGYFDPNEMDELIYSVSRSDVPYPKLILQNFFRTYRRSWRLPEAAPQGMKSSAQGLTLNR